ncbi:glycosyltransferase family 2 protein [Flavobacterium sp. IMCC34518]|uniref:glycosyltransferase family 2 protein n=1 Tax=Flavobacterium sp. IMCC34518 TaxID=3003623 RepID=UPI0024829F09|nr:glycosyltransferase family 2 protein [Flavobacterium sp. IMCC34518]
MLISIIIPTYNRAYLIGETLDSILAQTYTNWECIVVDDGSTDNTAKVVRKYIKEDKRFQYYSRLNDRTKGANTCRNYGFELSKGEYIKWFDSDDIMHPSLLEKQLNSIDKNIDCSVCKVAYYDFENDDILKENTISSDHLIEDYLVGEVTFYISGPLWSRLFLNNQKELFDEKISNLDDWDFNLRMLYQEPFIVCIDEPLIQYRIHETSLSQEIDKLNFRELESEFRAIKKHIFLLKKNKKVDQKILKRHLKNRYQFILRKALIENNKYKFYYFKKLLIIQCQLLDFLEMIKITIGFTVYIFLKKGYKLL